MLTATRRIPVGETRPYGWVAREAGRPRAVRAVGSVLARNPVPLLVPCHRVVRADGHLGEYMFGPEHKQELLRAEHADLDRFAEYARRGVHYLASDSTRIVCFPSCHNARRITAAHRREFRTTAAALAAGYRPCLSCRSGRRRPSPELRSKDLMSTHTATGTIAGLDRLDWPQLTRQLDEQGYATTPPLLSPEQCGSVVAHVRRGRALPQHRRDGPALLRRGQLPLLRGPAAAAGPGAARPSSTRRSRHRQRWAERLGERTLPPHPRRAARRVRRAGPDQPTPLVLRYGPSGYNCLHQDVYGELTFPLQFLVMLSRPDEDFTGGESVFVEQRPRQQSRPMVARPRQGEAVIFPVRHRPKLGTRGYHRVQLRHGVSAVHSGDRHVLGIIFHNAR